MTVKARYERGVFRPLEPVALAEGTIVDVTSRDAISFFGESTSDNRRAITHEEAVKLFREMAAQSKPVTDGFSGADHDKVLYTREAHP